MATVTIQVNKRPYRVNCDPGQEAHLEELGRYIDMRIGQLSDAGVQSSDINMLLLASLLIADELTDAQNKLDKLDAGEPATDGAANGAANVEARVAEALNSVAQRIEDIAGRLSND